MYIELPGYHHLFAIRLKVDRAKIEQLQRLNNIIKETPDALEMRVETGAVYETSEMRPAFQEISQLLKAVM